MLPEWKRKEPSISLSLAEYICLTQSASGNPAAHFKPAFQNNLTPKHIQTSLLKSFPAAHEPPQGMKVFCDHCLNVSLLKGLKTKNIS